MSTPGVPACVLGTCKNPSAPCRAHCIQAIQPRAAGVAAVPAAQVCPNHGREPARCNYFDCRGAGKCGELAGWKKGWWKPDAAGVGEVHRG
jgi:hypothetical protein